MDELFNSRLNYMAAEQPVVPLLPKRLKQLRGFHLLTQNEVAPVLHMDRSTYAYYETGKTCPDFSTVVRLAHLFNVTTDYLLGADSPDPKLRDSSSSSYAPSLQKAISGEWSLRESEQKLIMAFRYLNKDAQSEILRSVEKAAAEQYERRRTQRQKKNRRSSPQEPAES